MVTSYPCAVCKTQRRVLVDGEWRTCECVNRITIDAYLKPSIKGTDKDLPEGYRLARPRLKWANYSVLGPGSRYRVWTALERFALCSDAPTYECIDIARLPDIWFEGDDSELSKQDLVNFRLLILVAGKFYVPNKMMREIVGTLLDQRRALGHITWVMSELNVNALRGIYPAPVVEVLTSLPAPPPVGAVILQTVEVAIPLNTPLPQQPEFHQPLPTTIALPAAPQKMSNRDRPKGEQRRTSDYESRPQAKRKARP